MSEEKIDISHLKNNCCCITTNLILIILIVLIVGGIFLILKKIDDTLTCFFSIIFIIICLLLFSVIYISYLDYKTKLYNSAFSMIKAIMAINNKSENNSQTVEKKDYMVTIDGKMIVKIKRW